jgi:hypothetical protein
VVAAINTEIASRAFISVSLEIDRPAGDRFRARRRRV